jgi:hypothetical protein
MAKAAQAQLAPTLSDEIQLGRSHAMRAVLVGAAGSAHGRSCIACAAAALRIIVRDGAGASGLVMASPSKQIARGSTNSDIQRYRRRPPADDDGIWIGLSRRSPFACHQAGLGNLCTSHRPVIAICCHLSVANADLHVHLPVMTQPPRMSAPIVGPSRPRRARNLPSRAGWVASMSRLWSRPGSHSRNPARHW